MTTDLNSVRLRTKLDMRDVTKSAPQEVDVEINTDSDPAPEVALVGMATGEVSFHRYSGGGWSKDRRCSPQVAQSRNKRRNVVTLSVPTGCLGEPAVVRVRVAAVNGSKSYDLAPVKGWSKPVTTTYPTLLAVSTPPSEVVVTPDAVYAYTGTVSGQAGRTVRLERYLGGAWTTVASTTTRSNLTYRMTYLPSGWTTQNTQLRISVEAAGNQRAATSRPFWINYVFTPSGPRVVTEAVSGDEAVVYGTAANGTGRTVLYRSDRPQASRFVAWGGRLVEADNASTGPVVRTQATPGQPWVTLEAGPPGSCITQAVATPGGRYVAWGAGTGTGTNCGVDTIAVTQVGSDWVQRIPAGATSSSVKLIAASGDELLWRVGGEVRTMTLSDGSVDELCPGIANVTDLAYDDAAGPLVRGNPPGEAISYWKCNDWYDDGYDQYYESIGSRENIHGVAGFDGAIAIVGERNATDLGPYFDVVYDAGGWTPRRVPYAAYGSRSVRLEWLTGDWLVIAADRVTLHACEGWTPRLALTLPEGERFVGTYRG